MSLTSTKILKEFTQLIEMFLNKTINAKEFESKYLRLWRQYRDVDKLTEVNLLSEGTIDKIFISLDCYCSDPELRDDEDLNDEQLFNEVLEIFLKSKGDRSIF